MKGYMIKLKKVNMLCNKCVMHVLKTLTKLEGIKELEVNLNKKSIRIVLSDQSITRDMIITMVNNAIEGIKPMKLAALN
ncbi:MAG TPA: heavy-metal-associated domain-containing protein [Patescibacteria group bacterium]|nr:heavy-metal-associated domain-containing protein [Patescibacteria group bacterium]